MIGTHGTAKVGGKAVAIGAWEVKREPKPASVYDHPDYLAFVRSMRERPDDDVIRLAVADWLQERGEGERAEFIRVQVELSKADQFDGWECKVCCARPQAVDDFDLGEVEHGKGCYRLFEDGGGSEFVETAPAYKTIRERAWKLFKANEFVWFNLPTNWKTDVYHRPDGRPLAVVSRGFVGAVNGPAAAWLEHGDALLTQHPVTRVSLTSWPLLQFNSGNCVDSLKFFLEGGGREFSLREVARKEAGLTTNNGLGRYHNWLVAVLHLHWPGVTFDPPPPLTR